MLDLLPAKLHVFHFGAGGYDKQSAVVLAGTAGQALEILQADLARQAAELSGQPHIRRVGRDGLDNFYHNQDRLRRATHESDMQPWTAEGPIAYIYGLDG